MHTFAANVFFLLGTKGFNLFFSSSEGYGTEIKIHASLYASVHRHEHEI